MIAFAVFAALLLALANGANDNCKGVATLYGSRTSSYRTALIWGTATTLLGSLLAVVLAQELLQRFSGKGIVPDETSGYAIVSSFNGPWFGHGDSVSDTSPYPRGQWSFQ